MPEGFEHWIIKFTPRDYPWRGEKEFEIYKKACAAGITMSECALYKLDGLSHFITKRFDREGVRHHHVQTLSSMAHFPMSVPLEFRTYEQYLATVDALHLGYGLQYYGAEQTHGVVYARQRAGEGGCVCRFSEGQGERGDALLTI